MADDLTIEILNGARAMQARREIDTLSIDSKATIFLAKIDGVLAGHLALVWKGSAYKQFRTSSIPEIRRVRVCEGFGGRHVMRSLMEAAYDRVHAHKLDRVGLTVGLDNRAYSIYAGWGFEETSDNGPFESPISGMAVFMTRPVTARDSLGLDTSNSSSLGLPALV